MGSGPAVPGTGDPCVLVGELAAMLAAGQAIPEALTALVASLGLRSAVLRSTDGELLGVGGESVQAVPFMRAVTPDEAWLEFAVRAHGAHAAVLTVRGARPSQMPALRSVAAVLGLALVPSVSSEPATIELVEDLEAEQGQLADALHDGPMQTLMAARYAADALTRGGDPQAVRDAVQQAVVELRRQLWQVRPRGETGLVSALGQLSDRLVEAGHPPLAVSGDGADLVGPPAVAAFRVVQEASAGSRSSLRVLLRQTRSAVLVELAADEPLVAQPRWGRRTAAVGGHLSGSGGRITVSLPTPPSISSPFNASGHARTSS